MRNTIVAFVTALVFFFSGQAMAIEKQEVRLGLAAPFTGPASAFGEMVKSGFDFAIRRSNRTEDSPSLVFKGVYEDDACDPKQAVNAANRLISKGVLTATHICDSPSQTVKSIYVDSGILFASITKREDITKGGKGLVFQVMASHKDYAQKFYDDVIRSSPKKRIGILATNDYYGLGLRDAMRDVLKEHNQEFSFEEIITDTNTKDYRSVLTKAKQSNPDILILSLWDHMIGPVMRQAAEVGLSAIMMSGDSGGDISIPQIAGRSSDGLIFASVDFVNQLSHQHDLANEMSDAGVTPHLYCLYGFFVASAMIDAVRKADKVSTDDVIKVLNSKEIITPFAKIRFNNLGQARGIKSTLYVWKDGKVYPYRKE